MSGRAGEERKVSVARRSVFIDIDKNHVPVQKSLKLYPAGNRQEAVASLTSTPWGNGYNIQQSGKNIPILSSSPYSLSIVP